MTKNINLLFEYSLFFVLLSFSIILAFFGNFSYAVKDGINLWVACVIPALFPYFFITAILTSLSIMGKFSNLLSPLTNKIFKVNGSLGYALFISLISGYPIGAKTVADLKNQGMLSSTEAVRASIICSSSSPMFLIGSVGSIMFNNKVFGALLFISHLLSVLLNGFLFSFYKRKEKPKFNNFALFNKKVDNLLSDAVYSAVTSILTVGGLITIFYTLTEILFSLNLLTPFIKGLTFIFKDENLSSSIVLGAFECTKGLKALSNSNIEFLTLPISLFICGFGGVSVICQSLAFLKSAKIKTAPFLLSKVTSAVIGFLIGLIFSFLFL